jgi:hypothetical protein
VEPPVVAELRVALTGVELPADKAKLLEYAVQRHVDPHHLDALQSLSNREFRSLDDVVDELLHAGL